MNAGYQIASLDELESMPVDDEGLMWRPIRRRFGITAFGTNAYTAAKAGERVVEEHTEATNGHEELYVVLRGRATFTLDGEEVDAPAGTRLREAGDEARCGRRGGRDDRDRLRRADRQAVRGLEVGGGVRGIRLPPARRPRAGDGDDPRRLESDPDHWASNYHYACLLALQGRGDEALEKLARAVELNKQAAEWAADDEDFASIRDDPRFASAVAGQA